MRFLQHIVHHWDMGLAYTLAVLQLPYFDIDTVVLNICDDNLNNSYDCCTELDDLVNLVLVVRCCQ